MCRKCTRVNGGKKEFAQLTVIQQKQGQVKFFGTGKGERPDD